MQLPRPRDHDPRIFVTPTMTYMAEVLAHPLLLEVVIHVEHLQVSSNMTPGGVPAHGKNNAQSTVVVG